MNNDLQEFMTEEENIAYLRAYKGSRMIIDGFQRRIDEAIADKNEAITEKNKAITEKKKVLRQTVNLLIEELNISLEEAMQKLNITEDMLN